MRSLLDANILLRTLLPSDNPERAVAVILRSGYARRYTLLSTDELHNEVLRKATTKPALARYIPQAHLHDSMSALRRGSIMLPHLLPPFPRVCRDAKDDYVVAYAESGLADYLVTDDEDLLVLDGRFLFRILRPAEFLTVLRERGLA